MVIDYRSDSVTRPTPAMVEAMMAARVGDDVFGEDPTINRLEEMVAEIFGVEAALYCPSGTMTNQIAIKCHTQPGDEVICDASAHVYLYEGGGIAFHSGASVKLINGSRGLITAAQVKENINGPEVYRSPVSLVCLENTANLGGGSCYDLEEIKKIRQVCDEHQVKLHLDGARLFNALVAKGESAKDYGLLFNSLSVCLSKSLGCPVGSLLAGSKDFIRKARRLRKVFGGGMRQGGFLAAAGIYALENHIQRLHIDHDHAKMIAGALSKKEFVGEILPAETNIIIFEVKLPCTPDTFVAWLKQHNILGYAISATQVRLVTHLDITPEMVERTIEIINSFETQI